MRSFKTAKNEWEILKDFLHKKTKMPKLIMDYIAVFPILEMCCFGMSTSKIADALFFDLSYIKNSLMEFFSFSGWESDLDLNPMLVYNSCKDDKEEFVYECWAISDLSDQDIENCFNICKRLKSIEKGIERYYNNEYS